MSKVLRTAAVVAGTVAAVATGLGMAGVPAIAGLGSWGSVAGVATPLSRIGEHSAQRSARRRRRR